MCFPSSPKAPPPAPPPPTYDKAETNEDIIARDNTRKRLRGAMNTRESILTQGMAQTSGKTMLGQ
jgi:hypothetical protein